jgi:hypothetical protein
LQWNWNQVNKDEIEFSVSWMLDLLLSECVKSRLAIERNIVICFSCVFILTGKENNFMVFTMSVICKRDIVQTEILWRRFFCFNCLCCCDGRNEMWSAFSCVLIPDTFF